MRGCGGGSAGATGTTYSRSAAGLLCICWRMSCMAGSARMACTSGSSSARLRAASGSLASAESARFRPSRASSFPSSSSSARRNASAAFVHAFVISKQWPFRSQPFTAHSTAERNSEATRTLQYTAAIHWAMLSSDHRSKCRSASAVELACTHKFRYTHIPHE